VIVAITGKPKSGKTTLVKGLSNLLEDKAVGFYTEDVKGVGRRIGFDIVTTWGERLPLARVGSRSPFKVGRYAVMVQNLKHTLDRLREKTGDVLIIDEVGKMELLLPEFAIFVDRILDSKDYKHIILTIPWKDIHPLVADIRENADILIDLDTEKISPEEVLANIEKGAR